jgi:hypothetical protein
VFSGKALNQNFKLMVNGKLLKMADYDIAKLGQLQFVRKNVIAFLYTRNKQTKKEEVQVFKQEQGYGEF